MNENVDLTKILKNCPEGFELYTPLYGKVFFFKINKKDSFSIVVRATTIGTILFTKEGHFFETATNGECLLLPSNEMRDWNKFITPWYKKERFDPKTLQPFDKVIAKCNDFKWVCEIFSHYDISKGIMPYVCVGGFYNVCIPYNEETKHLVGTKDEAPDFYKYWEE